jgi:hypothetical protein
VAAASPRPPGSRPSPGSQSGVLESRGKDPWPPGRGGRRGGPGTRLPFTFCPPPPPPPFPPSPPPPAPPHGAPTALAPSQPPSSPPPHPVFAPPGAPSHPRKLTGPRSPERELTLHCFLWGGSVSSLGDSHCQNPAECQGLRLPALIPLQDPITLESFLILIKSLTLFKCPATYSPL